MDKDTMRKEIGERIRARRLELGMSQLDLALKIGYKTKAAVSKIEKGQRGMDLDRAQPLADALQTTTDYLMGAEKMDLIHELEEVLITRSEDYLRNLLVVVRSYNDQQTS